MSTLKDKLDSRRLIWICDIEGKKITYETPASGIMIFFDDGTFIELYADMYSDISVIQRTHDDDIRNILNTIARQELKGFEEFWHEK